jgi:hypothetical protein
MSTKMDRGRSSRVMRRPSAIQIVFALVLAMSAAGFALAARAERNQETSVAVGAGATEGSGAREAAERGQSALSTTTETSPTSAPGSPVSNADAVEPSPSAPEGTPSREAAEEGQATTTTAAPATIRPSGTIPGPTAPAPSSLQTLSSASTASDRPVGETLFGINTESTGATAVGVVILLAAAAAVLLAKHRWPFVMVALLAGTFALLDLREGLHQHDETRLSLVIAATALVLAHLTAAVLGILTALTVIDLNRR